MDGNRFCDGEFCHRLGEDAFPFLLGEDGMMSVVELGDVSTFVVVADEAFENDEGSTSGILYVGAESSEVERSFLDEEHGRLTSGEGRHEGDGLSGGEEIGPVGEFVVDGRFDMRQVEREVMLETEFFPKTGEGGGGSTKNL